MEPVVSLVTTELVTNAVVHAAGQGVELRLCQRDDWLRVEVWDGDAQHHPHRVVRELTAESGRGLAMVGSLATAWGSHVDGVRPGKTVWCELEL